MKKADKFGSVLSEIYNVSQQILKESIFFSVNEKKIKKRLKEAGEKEVDTAYENMVDNALHDATCVISEKKAFINFVLNNGSADAIPFFIEVWRGEMYGRDGIEGLEMLLQDLKDQLDTMNIDDVLEGLKVVE